jgi:UDP-GlcNAc:undecaprenyl-phosphate GlcNAc-1-phosphate transferase
MQNGNYFWLIYSAYFIGAIVFSILINFIFLRFAQNLGMRNQTENKQRWSHVQKPAFGGISFYIIFLLSFTSFTVFFSSREEMPNTVMLGLVFATALSFLMGLADDAFNTRPMLKLAVQILSAFILIYTGTYIDIFDSELLNYSLTIFWVVGMMNSINMLDNMDAITSLISIIAIISTLVILFLTGNFHNIYFFTLLGVLASLLGFLFFNWSPSKLFMGDTGSQFLGLFLAFIGIKYIWNIDGLFLANPIIDKFILIMAFFAVPLIDTLTVTINRIWRKQSPMIGGKDHTTHTMAYMGLSDKQVAIFFAFLSVLFSIITIYMISVKKGIDGWSELLIVCLFLALFTSFLFLNRLLLKSQL